MGTNLAERMRIAVSYRMCVVRADAMHACGVHAWLGDGGSRHSRLLLRIVIITSNAMSNDIISCILLPILSQ